MSFKYGFYNSVDHDRVYDATDMSSIFDGIIKDGVFASIGHGMLVSAGPGLGVTVGTGKAWFDHTWNWLTAELPLSVDAADAAYNRIDAVVIEVNATSRTNTIKVITGTPSSSAAKPELLPYQYPLAYVTVRKNTTSISAGDLEITVGTAECPLVTGVLETIDLTPIIEQYKSKWNDDFYEWFNHLQNELDSNQAANLQNQIDKKDDFHIGDLLATKATDLDDTWLYCNGATYYGDAYPEASSVLNIATKNNDLLYFGSVWGALNNANMIRKVNGRFMYVLRSGGIDTEGRIIVVKNGAKNTLPTISYERTLYESTGAGHRAAFVTYNEYTRKYIYGISHGYSTSASYRGEIYELTSVEPITYGSRVGVFPNSDSSSNVFDFIWWRGYYWCIMTRPPEGSGSYIAEIYKSENPVDVESWIKVYQYENSLSWGATFSIIDNALCVLARSQSPSYPKTINLLSFVHIASPDSIPVYSYIENMPDQFWNILQRWTKPITKIGAHLYLDCDGVYVYNSEGYMYELNLQGNSLVSITKVAFGDEGTAYNKILSVTETDEYYYAAIQRSAQHGTETQSVRIYRQEKLGELSMDLSSITKWELVGEQPYNTSVRWVTFGPIFVDNYGQNIFELVYQEDSDSSHQSKLAAYAIDTFTVPSVADTAAGFRHYIKVGTSKGFKL